MSQKQLILDRYRPLGEAGAGGFGTVRVAWDPRIQRKVAIKTIELSAIDAERAALPGADAVDVALVHKTDAHPQTADDSLQANQSLETHKPQEVNPVQFQEANPAQLQEADPVQLQEVNPAQLQEANPAQLQEANPVQLHETNPAQFQQVDPVHSLAHLPGLDEARTAAMLQDSRIVTVYDFEVRDRTAYLIMEYVEGLTLTRLLQHYSDYITLDSIAAIFEAVAGALVVAHKAGVLHLDIKPDNILINAKGQVKVTDFGLATLADAAGQGVAGGGTIGYMPLEQMRREHLDVRTDEWSLAAVLYEMLSGENPFFAPNLDAAPDAILNAELVLPSLCWEGLDDQIDDVIFYALDPSREERYATIADFAEEVRKFLGSARKGRTQLATIVEHDLRPAAVSDAAASSNNAGADTPADAAARDASGRDAARDDTVRGAVRGVAARDAAARGGKDASLAAFPQSDSLAQELGIGELGITEESRRSSAEHVQRRQRVARTASDLATALLTPHMVVIVGRVFAAVAAGFLGYLAATNIAVFANSTTPFAPVAWIVAICVAALAVWRPSAGAIVGYVVLAGALLLGNSPLTGAVLLVVAFIWWYFIGRAGAAEGNVALSVPLAGAVGCSAVAPLAAGASLRIFPAVIIALFACFIGLVMGAFGSGWLIGWDAGAFWNFSHANVDTKLLRMLTNPVVLVQAASWVVSAAVQAAVGSRGTRSAEFVGLALGAIVIVAGVVAMGLLSPGLFVGARLIRILIGTLVPIAVVLAGLVFYRPTE